MSAIVPSLPCVLRQGLTLNLDLTGWLDLVVIKPRGSSCLHLGVDYRQALLHLIFFLFFNVNVGGSDSGHRAFMANTLPTEPNLFTLHH